MLDNNDKISTRNELLASTDDKAHVIEPHDGTDIILMTDLEINNDELQEAARLVQQVRHNNGNRGSRSDNGKSTQSNTIYFSWI